ncbi:MAG TPA: hypothetical protein VFC64_01485 [Atopostipes sp.]|nr:hypothetical protein [Atopostipes sp.]
MTSTLELADVDALELQFYVRDWPEGAETTIEFDPASLCSK